MKWENLKVKVAADEVLKKINCLPDSETYEEFLEEYKEIEEEIEKKVAPVGAMAFSSISETEATEEIKAGTKVAYVIVHIGAAISQYSQKFFSEGDFVKGMLVDAYADTYLFDLEKSWTPMLIENCRAAGVGIGKRLEIPGDLPMEVQRSALHAIGEENLPDSRISDCLMFYPVKTLCYAFLLTEDPSIFRVEHNCRRCKNVDCNMRSIRPVRIQVRDKGGDFSFFCEGQERILDKLLQVNPHYSAVCGKKGRCGKCAIRLLSGETKISPEEKTYFSEEELKAGYRLSCKAYPESDCEIELLFGEETFEVLTESGLVSPKETQDEEKAGKNGAEKQFGIAIDIGTTTIAGQLLCLEDEEMRATAVSLNHQRNFGADVISRIQASNEGKGELLRSSIRSDLAEVIAELQKKSGVDSQNIKKVVLAGNTTMGHLLMGYSCETLGRIPFQPVNIEEIWGTAEEILGSEVERASLLPETVVCLLPGISAFVGADILAGLLHCEFDKKEKPVFFLDLGTNGEMAVGNKEKILVTSTAAGPAFEGGNIKWGRGSIPGAICHVKLDVDGSCHVETIGGKAPVGICGSGLIEAVSELLRCGFLDETGRLEEVCQENGFELAKTVQGEAIVLTQKDIRELQLAKAAVRAGIELLLEKYGLSYGELDQVYLAGGFGYGLNQEKAARIGLIPEEFLSCIQVVGNASLAGARDSLLSQGEEMRAKALRSCAQEVALASEKKFQDVYVECMYFEE